MSEASKSREQGNSLYAAIASHPVLGAVLAQQARTEQKIDSFMDAMMSPGGRFVRLEDKVDSLSTQIRTDIKEAFRDAITPIAKELADEKVERKDIDVRVTELEEGHWKTLGASAAAGTVFSGLISGFLWFYEKVHPK